MRGGWRAEAKADISVVVILSARLAQLIHHVGGGILTVPDLKADFERLIRCLRGSHSVAR